MTINISFLPIKQSSEIFCYENEKTFDKFLLVMIKWNAQRSREQYSISKYYEKMTHFCNGYHQNMFQTVRDVKIT